MYMKVLVPLAILASGSLFAADLALVEEIVAKCNGDIITRGDLYRTVWGGELRPGDRSVDVYVSKLRNKLEVALPDRRFIHTHPGFGYRFQPQPSRNVHIEGSPG